MRILYFLVSGLLAVYFGGCALHPLPKDYARVPTVKITKHIRCETQRALHSILVDYLIEFDDVRTSQLGRALKSGSEQLSAGLKGRIHPLAKKRIERFQESVIGYAFRFKITEDNDNSGGMTLSMPFTNGSVAVALAGGKKKTRDNTRKFKIVETLEATALDLDCSSTPSQRQNLIYPIAGNIGMEEVLLTFINLSLDGTLKPEKKDVSEFSEQLTFTTKLSGSIKPTLKLDPVSDRWRVTEATGTFASARTDLHEVTVALKLPTIDDGKAVKKTKAQRQRAAKKSVKRTLKDVELERLDAALRRLEESQ